MGINGDGIRIGMGMDGAELCCTSPYTGKVPGPVQIWGWL